MSDSPILCSYPRSGRTWLGFLFESLGINIELNHLRSDISNVHWNDFSTDYSSLFSRKLILLKRDPVDCLVSGYYFCKYRLANFTGSLEEFIKHPGYGIRRWVSWHQAIERSGHPNMCLVTYENLVNNTLDELHRLVKFLHIKAIVKEDLKTAIEQCAFSKLQEKERFGKLKGIPKHTKEQQKSAFFRVGKPNEGRALVSAELLEFIEHELQNPRLPQFENKGVFRGLRTIKLNDFEGKLLKAWTENPKNEALQRTAKYILKSKGLKEERI